MRNDNLMYNVQLTIDNVRSWIFNCAAHCTLFLLLPAASFAQDYEVVHIGAEGTCLTLNDQMASAFCQTRDGFAWVGTGRGVERLDGTQTALYRFEQPLESGKPAPQRVTAFCERRDGELFVGNIQGLWLADHRACLLRRVAEEVIDKQVNNLCLTTDSLLLVTTAQGHYVLDMKNEAQRLTGEQPTMVGVRSDVVQRIAAPIAAHSQRDSLLAVGTDGMGLYLFNAHTGSVQQHFTAEDDALLSNRVTSVQVLADGSVLCGTPFYQGFNLLRRRQTGVERIAAGLPEGRDTYVRSYYQTPTHTLVGTRDGFYANGQHFSTGTHSALRSNIIFCFAPWQGDSILVGTCDGGLAVFDPKTSRFGSNALTQHCAPQGDIMQMQYIDEHLWLATSEGIYSYAPAEGLRHYNRQNAALPGDLVYGFYKDKMRLLLATDGGVSELDLKTGRCGQPLTTEPTRCVYRTRDGQHILYLLLDNRVVVDGSLLPGILAYDVAEATDGALFFATPQGVLRMERDLKQYRLLTDGAQHVLCSPGARLAWREDGRLTVCATDGLYSVSTVRRQLQRCAHIQSLCAEGSGQKVNLYNAPADTLIRLASDQNTLSLSFSISDITILPDARFEYLLEGRDTLWQEADYNKAQFFNLPSGIYRLRARLLMDSESETSLRFVVARQWQRALAYAALAFVLFGAVGYVLWRRRGAKQPAMEAMQKGKAAPAKHALPAEEAERIAAQLRQYMAESKAYLNVDLKQAEVAVAIGQPTYVVSAVLGQYMHTNWYDFMNAYRVEAFKQAVADGMHERYSVVALAERCGFKSKASFFRAFKAQTGMTPSEYIGITKQ